MVQTRSQARSGAVAPTGQANTSTGHQNVGTQKQAGSKALAKNQPQTKVPVKSQPKAKNSGKIGSKRKAPVRAQAQPQTPASSPPKSKTPENSENRAPAAANGVAGPRGSPLNPPAGTPRNGPTPSPTSDGPEFNSPLRAPTDAIIAARSEVKSNVGGGFKNPGRLCYRNATIVMLLHSNRFMSWIEHRHIPNLKAAGLRIKPYSKPLIDALLDVPAGDGQTGDKTTVALPIDYTDVLCELFELSRAYWDERQAQPETLNIAMGFFWDYATSPRRDKEMKTETYALEDRFTTKMREAAEDQCASEFLGWLITLSIEQLKYFTEKRVNQRESRLDQATLDKIVGLGHVTISELLQITQTQRARCMQCGSIRKVKTRFSRLDEQTILSLQLPATANSQVPVTLEDCFTKNSEDDFEWRCSTCSNGTTAYNPDNGNGAKKNIWRKIYSAPEVLFLQLARFKIRLGEDGSVELDRAGNIKWGKDATKVTIPEELDLTPFLERRGEPADISAKYRLEGIVSHFGGKDEGHYIAYVHRRDSWYVFDDSSEVRKISFQAVVDQFDGFTPYVLLYERIPDAKHDAAGRERETLSVSSTGNASSAAGGAGDNASAGDTSVEPDDDDNNSNNATNEDGGSPNRGSQARSNGANDVSKSTTAQLKLATANGQRPGPGQLSINITTGFGRYKILLPTLVLENYVPDSHGKNDAYVKVRLEDSLGQRTEVEGIGSFERPGPDSTGDGEDASSIMLNPNFAPGQTPVASVEIISDDQHQRTPRTPSNRSLFNGSSSGDTELDPALLPDVPDHSPSQHRPRRTHGAGSGERQNRSDGSSGDSKRSPSSLDNGAPFLYQTPTVQTKLRQIFTHMENYYEDTIKRHLHAGVVPIYQAEIVALNGKIAEYERLLGENADDAEEQLFYWRAREAGLLETHQKHLLWIADLQEQNRALRAQYAWQHYNPTGPGAGLGIRGVETVQPVVPETVRTGARQKRPLGQTNESHQESVFDDRAVWPRTPKRVKFSNNSSVAGQVGDATHLQEDIDYDSRELTELHYDSAGGRLYDDSEDGGDVVKAEKLHDVFRPEPEPEEDEEEDDDYEEDEDEDDDDEDEDDEDDYEEDDDDVKDTHHPLNPTAVKEESPLPDYEDMVPEDERYDASTETSPTPWLYQKISSGRRVPMVHLLRRFPSTPTRVVGPRQATPATAARTRPSPLQIRHSPAQGRVDGRVRSSPHHYQTSRRRERNTWSVDFDEDGVPRYYRV
ncbi:hypothetical protein Z517_07371 [Fonsecaea pedrosoi CBS 271.37]|uniref:ubiquitinyl hydrolase 1 n=1 Tax=Fonsecaea pedrosoi CBS 271.37 TaxID=1442368 RepID=A0A0D2GQA0_9EURO|nr:uncharacterized protein Z517_07371 [Fonsecaea pedrosoi CBS 271.37]KIW80755.1 hypothetical protein Z517_07371 [Fonsecaea pedrosoi CBS 271.37]